MATERLHRRHTPGTGPVALFVDWDNFAIGLRQEMPERPPDLGPILRWARRTGTLIVSRAYGEWRDAAERLAIYNAGVDAVYAPVLPLGGSLAARSGAGGAKSLADTAMAVDVAEFLTLVPSVTTLILATSDKDLIPVIRFAQKRGVFSGVVGSDRTAAALRDLADEFVTYRQLLEDEAPQPVAMSRPVTVPPMRVARPLRRFGIDPVGEPMVREIRPAIASAPPVRRDPAPEPVAAGAEADGAAEDADANRRRRRGGRRRRGAETLSLGVADAVSQGEETALDVAEEAILEASAPTPTPPAPSAPPARPAIVPPMIAPRAPRPSAERFVSTVAPVTTSAPVAPPPVIAEVAPPAVSPPSFVASSPSFGRDAIDAHDGAPAPTDRQRSPRVQLPGERLRRLAPADRAPATELSRSEEPAAVPDPLVRAAAPEAAASATNASEPATEAPDRLGGDFEEPRPAAIAAGPVAPDLTTEDAVPVDAVADAAPRARRRRGGRSARPGDADAPAEVSLPVIEGPIASPNDPDSADAPQPTSPEGGPRGRRRGGRSRSTA